MLDSLWTIPITEPDGVTPLNKIYEKETDDASVAKYFLSLTIDDPTLPPDFITLKKVNAKASADFYGTKRFFATVRTESIIPQPTGDRLTPMITYINGTRPLGFSTELLGQHDKLVAAMIQHAMWGRFTNRGEI
jgi:hypothetical protein